MKKEISKKKNYLPQIKQIAISAAVIGFVAVVLGMFLVLDTYSSSEPRILPSKYFDYIGYATGGMAFVVIGLVFALAVKLTLTSESVKNYTNGNLAIGLYILASVGLFVCSILLGTFAAGKYTDLRGILLSLIEVIVLAMALMSTIIAAGTPCKKNTKK